MLKTALKNSQIVICDHRTLHQIINASQLPSDQITIVRPWQKVSIFCNCEKCFTGCKTPFPMLL